MQYLINIIKDKGLGGLEFQEVDDKNYCTDCYA